LGENIRVRDERGKKGATWKRNFGCFFTPLKKETSRGKKVFILWPKGGDGTIRRRGFAKTGIKTGILFV